MTWRRAKSPRISDDISVVEVIDAVEVVLDGPQTRTLLYPGSTQPTPTLRPASKKRSRRRKAADHPLPAKIADAEVNRAPADLLMNQADASLLQEEISGSSGSGLDLSGSGTEAADYPCFDDEFNETGLMPENQLLAELLGQEILLTMQADQLNILGQTFRPIFCGCLTEVQDGFITLDPVIIKMNNAPFFRFPTPLCFVIEKIANFTPFDCSIRFPIP